jgi:hypothetical protein
MGIISGWEKEWKLSDSIANVCTDIEICEMWMSLGQVKSVLILEVFSFHYLCHYSIHLGRNNCVCVCAC